MIHDPVSRELLIQLIGDAGNEWDEVQKAKALDRLASPEERSRIGLMKIGNIMFRYRLLDLFAPLLGPSEIGNASVVPRAAKPRSTVRKVHKVTSFCFLLIHTPMPIFPKIYESLKDWPQILRTFCDLYRKHSPNVSENHNAISTSHNQVQRQFLAGINCFSSACRSREAVGYNKILCNILVLATCLWWFQMVCWLTFACICQ